MQIVDLRKNHLNAYSFPETVRGWGNVQRVFLA